MIKIFKRLYCTHEFESKGIYEKTENAGCFIDIMEYEKFKCKHCDKSYSKFIRAL